MRGRYPLSPKKAEQGLSLVLSSQPVQKLAEFVCRRIIGFSQIVIESAVVGVPVAIGLDRNPPISSGLLGDILPGLSCLDCRENRG